MVSTYTMPTALVPIAEASEEIETVCIVDTLVRGGIEVTLASVTGALAVKCSRGVSLNADKLITDCVGTEYDRCGLKPYGAKGACASALAGRFKP